MKRLCLLLLAAVLIAAPAVSRAAGGHDSLINIRDATPDAWVWVTVYSSHLFGDKIERAWCVNPGSRSQQHISTYTGRVRVEVTKRACAHPVMLDASLGATGNRADTPIVTHFYGEVSGSDGHYSFNRTNY